MSQRMTNILGYLTLFAILGAIWVLFGEDPSLNQGARGEKTFPDLEKTINQADEIHFAQNGQKVTLKRDNGLWTIQERQSYRAKGDKVRDFLRGIALSERREPKTASNDRFDQIGLGDKSLNITVYDQEQNSLAEFKMGSRRENSASGRSLTYIYKDGDTRSWLVSGLSAANADASWWLDDDLFLIDAKRTLELKAGGTVFIREPETNRYTIAKPETSANVIPAITPSDVVNFLSDVTFTDIQKRSNETNKALSTGYLKTYDGLSLAYSIYKIDNSFWLNLSASFNPDARDAGEEGILEGSPENGEQEAADINKKTSGWLFAVSDKDAEMLLRSTDDYIKNSAETSEN
ncbi:DUF4340 domain-containing protein [Kordiimonas sp. SCSIO 12610]|uniref:DUF4340 domain-containing protein n=1 Tax=Kordiimonas sp. SCSIO 12610 TaxID=2829597 RepID=UPI00210ACD38|nr:DUF4340 domain-containing protein [Kordiimonas sp. SCSIO 12610]UTW55721.1 DUF4340 domain-containing protein [Kordiimonas sp. SCSIO 12610]